MNVEIEIYLENNNLLDNFIARGSVSGLSAELLNGVFIEKQILHSLLTKQTLSRKYLVTQTF